MQQNLTGKLAYFITLVKLLIGPRYPSRFSPVQFARSMVSRVTELLRAFSTAAARRALRSGWGRPVPTLKEVATSRRHPYGVASDVK